MSEIVFIFGAGASKDAGAPLVSEFIRKADDLRSSIEDRFKADFNKIFEIREKLQLAHSKSKVLNLNNIESLFSVIEMGRIIKKLPDITDEEVKSLPVAIRRLIYRTLEETILFPIQEHRLYPTQSYNLFAQLLQSLNDYGRKIRCSIITFNYDLALDYALYYHNIAYDYCLTEKVDPNRASLLKLHGSLNWAKCLNAECKGIVVREFADYLQGKVYTKPTGKLTLASELMAHPLMHCNKMAETDPFIVPPTWNKMQYYEVLSNVWARAAYELSEAENVFVIGFSLTESDWFFRDLYSIGTMGRSIFKRFWVFDPDKVEVQDRFKKIIGTGVGDAFSYKEKRFSDAIPIIKSGLLG
jgi:NAD-dependent SIR2 family protein deacetylase